MCLNVPKFICVWACVLAATAAHAVFPDNPTSDYRSVGMIGRLDGGAFRQSGCGVAISAEWVISVAHVGGSLFVENDKQYPIVQKVVYKASEGEPADLVLFKLGQPVSDFTPVLLAPFQSNSKVAGLKGRTVYLVGYGQTARLRDDGMGWQPRPGTEGTRRVATNTIDYTEVDRYNIGKPDDPKWKSSECLVYDLDKPDDKSFSTLGSDITPDEGGVAAKDSGGGWFISQKGQSYLVAISATVGRIAGSRATSDFGFGAVGSGIHLAPYRGWIYSVTRIAGFGP